MRNGTEISTDVSGVRVTSEMYDPECPNPDHGSQCIAAFLSLCGVMMRYKPRTLPKNILKGGGPDFAAILECLTLNPHNGLMIEGVDQGLSLSCSFIRSYTDALVMTVTGLREHGDDGGLKLVVALLRGGSYLTISGRESTTRNLLKATGWSVDDNSGHKWGTGDKVESWTTAEGLTFTMDCERVSHYSEAVRQHDPYITFPWSS